MKGWMKLCVSTFSNLFGMPSHILVFIGRGFTWSVFSAEDKRSCFSEGEWFAVQLPLDRALAEIIRKVERWNRCGEARDFSYTGHVGRSHIRGYTLVTSP